MSELAKVISMPTPERMKELEEVKETILNQFEGMTSKEISLVFELVKSEVNTKLVFTV